MRSLRREFTTGEEELFLQRGKGLPMLRLSPGPGATLMGKWLWGVGAPCGDTEAEPNWLRSGCLGMRLRSPQRQCQAGRN